MQDGSNSKQLIAEKIKQSANILVTVSANPSVDALTAALGLTLMLNKLDKHATAVFSGVIPPAINFLEPGKTFENNVDSLRDFIIALDKDKADRLRYKVEDDVVRIFITPYRTKISQSDLQFSQGDFNVDLIVALGVEDQKDLDQAITAHGRILHDATVVTINAAAQKSSLGSIDWQDKNASSLSEMLAGMSELLKPGILDQQISTALLTGIVASTDRFSNVHTTPHVMTMAAQLMAAGANQQLIATKLQSIPAPVSPRREKPKAAPMPEAGKKVNAAAPEPDDGEMHINHGEEEKPQSAPLSMEPAEPAPAPEPETTPEPQPETESEPEAEPDLPIAPPAAQNFDDLKQAIQDETVQAAPQREMISEPPTPGSHNINDETPEADVQPKSEEDESYLTTHPSWQGREIKPPTMGGTLSATAEQALQDKMREESEEKRNHTILTHGGGQPNGGGQQPGQPGSSSRKRKRNRGGKGQGQNQQSQNQGQAPQQPAQSITPISAPEVPAPKPEPQPEPEPVEPAPQPQMPEPAPEPVEPAPVPEPPVAEPQPLAPVEPAPQPEPEEIAPQPAAVPPAPQPQAEIPVAPPPLVVSEPLSQPVEPAPAPEAPAPMPEPQAPAAPAVHEPTLEELEREAASHAATSVAPQTLNELEAAPQQADAASAPQTAPALQPLAPIAPAPAPQPQPLAPPQPLAQPDMSSTGLPPLPPMPDFGTLPPIPAAEPELPQQPFQQPQAPQPPQPLTPPTPPQAPQSAPNTPPAPTDPGQFRIPGQ